MTALVWDSREALSGVDRGVIYGSSGAAVVWNGLIAVKDSSTDSGGVTGYQNGEKYVQTRPYTSFSGSVEALTYPDQVDEVFDMSYRVLKQTGYELHLVYNATAIFSDMIEYRSLGDTQDIAHFNWDLSTLPVMINPNQATSHIIIDSTTVYPEVLTIFENILYGTSSTDPRIPDPIEVVSIFETNARFRIIDNGNGTWTAIGPDDWITTVGHTFTITTPSAYFLDDHTYSISSW